MKTTRFGILAAMMATVGAYRMADPDQTGAAAPAPEPVEHPLVTEIKAKFDNKVDVVDAKFHFKKKLSEAGVESKRPTLEIKLPVPSVEGIVEILTGGDQKQLDLLREAVNNIIMDRARELINADAEETLTQENFPLHELSWVAIANQPAAERRGGGIAKETWEEFAADYEAVMPSVTGKDLTRIKQATKVYLAKFSMVKTDKKVLALLQGQLALYLANSPNAEVYMDCVNFLNKKAQSLIEADSSNLLDAL